MKKYYFISHQETRIEKDSSEATCLENELIDIHPLRWQIKNRNVKTSCGVYEKTLLHFVEISEEDYTRFFGVFMDY